LQCDNDATVATWRSTFAWRRKVVIGSMAKQIYFFWPDVIRARDLTAPSRRGNALILFRFQHDL
jgi:hypothetical protein